MIGIDFMKGAYGKLQGRMGSKKFDTVFAGVGASALLTYIVMDHMIPDCPDIVETVAETITETIETEAI